MEYFILDKITFCGRIITGGINIDKRYLAVAADVVFIIVAWVAGLVSIGIYGDSLINIVRSAIAVAISITIYYFHIGNKLYQKLGWLKA